MLKSTLSVGICLLIMCFVNAQLLLHPLHALQLAQLTHPTSFAFLSTYAKDKKIIGLGETSHGTHEFYQAKSSIVQYLISQHQFKRIALEMDEQITHKLNDYVLAKHDQIDETLKAYGLYNAQEFKNLLVWIRHKNASIKSYKDKIQLLGFDQQAYWSNPLQRDSLMAAQFMQQLNDQKCIVWAHAVHLLKSNTWDTTNSGIKAMGNYLAQYFGSQYYLLVLDTQQGEVHVLENTQLKAHAFEVQKQLPVDHFTNFYLDLRGSYFNQLYPLTYLSSHSGIAQTLSTQLGIDLDGLLFIQQTTATEPIE